MFTTSERKFLIQAGHAGSTVAIDNLDRESAGIFEVAQNRTAAQIAELNRMEEEKDPWAAGLIHSERSGKNQRSD